MNIVGTMVGMTLMASASPMVMNMAITPAEASKRAQNFGIAESAAVIYAATNEGTTTLSAVPDGCTLDSVNAPAYEIECTEGTGTKYTQTVSRSFIADPNANNGNTIAFPMDPPESYTEWNCPGVDNILGWPEDPWGTAYYNEGTLAGKYCIPEAAQGGIDPNDDMSTWLWDLRVHFGG